MNSLADFPPFAILRHHGLAFFAFDFGRYVVAAAVVSAVVLAMRWLGLGHRKIQKRTATRADLQREVLQSVQAVLVYSFVSGFVAWGIDSGVLKKPQHGAGLGGDLVLLAAMIVAHDAYFYWAHRAMHHPRLFRLFHRAHHRSITPTPWAAYSFAIPEALVMTLFVPLWLWLVPTPVWVTLAWLIFQIARNTMGHAGYELMPRWWLNTRLTRWINTTTHHDLHHSGGFNTNYGLYFTWWDRLMGTEHPRYAQEFARVVQGGSQPATPQPATPPAQAALES